MTAIGIADKATLDIVKTNTDGISGIGVNINKVLATLISAGFPYLPNYGNHKDGDFNPVSNVTLTKHLYLWNDVVIPAGVTISAISPGVLIFANSITIGGLLTASGLGADGGSGHRAANKGGSGASGGLLYGGGGGGGGSSSTTGHEGGYGGDGLGKGGTCSLTGTRHAGIGLAPITTLFDIIPMLYTIGGGGGGATSDGNGVGGKGGGYVIISANTIVINSGGAIRAEGLNGGVSGYMGAGGGGGGAIILSGSLTNNGTISVAGGLPGAGSSWGDGKAGGAGNLLLLGAI